METNDVYKITEAVYALYCAKHDIDPAVKPKGFDKVDRRDVDAELYDRRIRDSDDPLFNVEER